MRKNYKKRIVYFLGILFVMMSGLFFDTINSNAASGPGIGYINQDQLNPTTGIRNLDSSYYQGAIFMRKDSEVKVESDNDSRITVIQKNKQWLQLTSEKSNYKMAFKITNCSIDADGDLCDVRIWTDIKYAKDVYLDGLKTGNYFGKTGQRYAMQIYPGTINSSDNSKADVYFHLLAHSPRVRFYMQYYKAGTIKPANITKQFGKVMDIDVVGVNPDRANPSQSDKSLYYRTAETVTKKTVNGKTTYSDNDVFMSNAAEGFRIKKNADTYIYSDSSTVSFYDKKTKIVDDNHTSGINTSELGVYNKNNYDKTTNNLWKTGPSYEDNDPKGIAYFSTSMTNGLTYFSYEGRGCGIMYTFTTPDVDFTYDVEYDANGGVSSKSTETCNYGKEYTVADAKKTGYTLQYWDSPRSNGYDSVRTIKDGRYFISCGNNKKLYLKPIDASTLDNLDMCFTASHSVLQAQWDVKYVGNGYYTITNANSKKELEVKGNSTKSKTAVQQYSSSNVKGHLWKIIKNEWINKENTNDENTYSIISAVDGNIGELHLATVNNESSTENTALTHLGSLNSSLCEDKESVTLFNPELVTGGNIEYNTESNPSKIIPNGQFYNLGEKNGKVKLTAVWKPITYNILYYSNGGDKTNLNPYLGDPFTYDKTYNLWKNEFTKKGYEFIGWGVSPTGGVTFEDEQEVKNLTSIDDELVNLYAYWDPIIYKVNYDGNGADQKNIIKTSLTYDKTYNLVKNTYTKEGYVFNGWNTQKDGNGTHYDDEQEVKNLSDNSDEIITLYAEWKPITYTILYRANGGNDMGPQTRTGHTYNVPKKLLKNPFTRTGYVFTGWNTQADGKGKHYDDEQEVVNLTTTQGVIIPLYAQWIDTPKANGTSLTILKKDGIKMIENNTLEDFLHNETNLQVKDDGTGIEISDYKITNLDEIKETINNAENGDKIEIKFKITYNTGSVGTELENPCILTIKTTSASAVSKAYNRYINNEKTLKNKSSWKDGKKKEILKNVLQKDISKVPGYDVNK